MPPQPDYVIAQAGCCVIGGAVCMMLTDVEPKMGKRPGSASEVVTASGTANEANLRAVGERKDGMYASAVRLGAGVAAFINPESLPNVLAFGGDRAANNFERTFGNVMKFAACLIGPTRDINAGGTQLCADICAGVVQDTDLQWAALNELLELSFFLEGGERPHKPVVAVPRLLGDFSKYQQRFEEAYRAAVKQLVDSETGGHAVEIAWRTDDVVTVEPTVLAKMDAVMTSDGLHPCLLSTEAPVGSAEVAFPAKITIKERVAVRDTECAGNPPKPLHRKITLLCDTRGSGCKWPTMLFYLVDSGHIDGTCGGAEIRMGSPNANDKAVTAMRAAGFELPA